MAMPLFRITPPFSTLLSAKNYEWENLEDTPGAEVCRGETGKILGEVEVDNFIGDNPFGDLYLYHIPDFFAEQGTR